MNGPVLKDFGCVRAGLIEASFLPNRMGSADFPHASGRIGKFRVDEVAGGHGVAVLLIKVANSPRDLLELLNFCARVGFRGWGKHRVFGCFVIGVGREAV